MSEYISLEYKSIVIYQAFSYHSLQLALFPAACPLSPSQGSSPLWMPICVDCHLPGLAPVVFQSTAQFLPHTGPVWVPQAESSDRPSPLGGCAQCPACSVAAGPIMLPPGPLGGLGQGGCVMAPELPQRRGHGPLHTCAVSRGRAQGGSCALLFSHSLCFSL